MHRRNLNPSPPAPNAKKLRVGVVGVGYLGRFHAEKYSALPEVEFVGVADLLPSRAQEIAERCRTCAFYDYRELLPRVDALSIVIPTDQHFPVAREALMAGKDILLEKPMTATLEEADELIAIAKEKGRILQIGHLERFNPAIVALQNRIQRPLYVEASRLTPFRGRGVEVDVVLDLMIHDLDIVLHLVSAEVGKVEAVGLPLITDKVDMANARVEFLDGCVANLTASRVSTQDQRILRIFQSDGFATIDYAAKRLELCRTSEAPRGMTQKAVEILPGDTLENEIVSFVHSAIHRTPPKVSGAEARRVLALAMEIREKIQRRLERRSVGDGSGHMAGRRE